MLSIPKIIHMIWIGPKECPYKENIQSYIDKNPDWEIKLWNNDNLPKIKNKWAFDIIDIWAVKADILRLEVLYKFGGIYVDVDSYCLKPLDDLIKNRVCFSMTSRGGKINNSILACPKKYKTFEILVNNLESHVKRMKYGKKARKIYSVHKIAGAKYIEKELLKDKNFETLDHGLKAGTRKIAGEVRYEKIYFDGYILQKHDNSWKVTSGTNKVKL